MISKSKAILLVILLAGAAIEAFAYSYVNSSAYSAPSSPEPGVTSSPPADATPSPTPMPSPAAFSVSNLTATPFEVGPGEPVTISVIVVNFGDLGGSYNLNVSVNDVIQGSKTIALLGKENQMVNFTVNESREGSYTLKIADLLGTFFVKTTPPEPMPTTLKLSNLFIDPIEAWAGQNVSVSVDVTDKGSENITYKLPINVDGVLSANINLLLSPGEKTTVTAIVNASSIGSHPVNVGGLNGVLRIVPTGKHTLHAWSDREGFAFTLDGTPVTTPYNVLLDVGTHIVSAPITFVKPIATWGAVVFTFAGWDDGSTNPTRTVDLQRELYTIAYYTRPGSCPSLYIWNGTDFTYSAEVSDGPGWLGYIDHFNADGSIVFSYNYPWDYIKLGKNTLQPKNGYYQMNIGETSDEIFYMDAVKLVAVDHSPDVDVFSTAGTYIYKLANQGTVYTVSKNLLAPVSATNGSGQNALPQISKMDEVFTMGTRWQWNSLTLNLGDLSQAKEIKLVVAATINWPTTSSGGSNFMKYASQPGVTPSPPPYMEVKAANGSWVRVPDDRQFPLPDVTDEVFVVNLTGLFAGNDYSLRINTYQDIRFDYVGIDTTSQQNVVIQSLNPSVADFQQVLGTKSNSTGNFTKYGDLTTLLLEADDKLVIGREGDSVSLKFPANLNPVPQGMDRDFFVFANVWFKGNGLPYLPFTVEMMPFQGMTSFPYSSNESYPFDDEHLSYLREYNTRVITASNSSQPPYNPASALANLLLAPLSSSSALEGTSLIFEAVLATCTSTILAVFILSVLRSKRKNIKL